MLSFRLRLLVPSIMGLALAAVGEVKADLITFDDGVLGSPVGTRYAGLGVTFQNAQWAENFVGAPFVNSQATAPFSIYSTTSGYFNSSTDPIIGTFSNPVTSVQILAVNVGFAGARMDAYDSVVGGSLVASVQAFGTTEKGEIPLGAGLFQHEEFLLRIDGLSIRRIELYRPNPGANDGIHFDNLSFSAVPEPSSLVLLCTGAVGLLGYVRRRTSLRNRA